MILKDLFPSIPVIVGAGSDYLYRVSVPREILARTLLARVSEIDYPNFKESVQDHGLAELYGDFWLKHRAYQDR
jgi:hypothetical protein